MRIQSARKERWKGYTYINNRSSPPDPRARKRVERIMQSADSDAASNSWAQEKETERSLFSLTSEKGFYQTTRGATIRSTRPPLSTLSLARVFLRTWSIWRWSFFFFLQRYIYVCAPIISARLESREFVSGELIPEWLMAMCGIIWGIRYGVGIPRERRNIRVVGFFFNGCMYVGEGERERLREVVEKNRCFSKIRWLWNWIREDASTLNVNYSAAKWKKGNFRLFFMGEGFEFTTMHTVMVIKCIGVVDKVLSIDLSYV